MAQLRIAYSKSSIACGANETTTKLDSLRPKMLRADSSQSLRLARKSARLVALAPRAATTVEKLVDDLLDELEGRRL